MTYRFRPSGEAQNRVFQLFFGAIASILIRFVICEALRSIKGMGRVRHKLKPRLSRANAAKSRKAWWSFPDNRIEGGGAINTAGAIMLTILSDEPI